MSDEDRRPSGASVRACATDRQQAVDALDAVGAVVSAHDRDHALSEPMPDSVTARVDQTLAYLSRLSDQRVAAPAFDDTAPHRSFTGRMLLAATAAAAVVAAAIAVPVVMNLTDDAADPATTAAPQVGDYPAATDAADSELILAALGRSVEGRFADPEIRDQCLAANGVPSGTSVLGSQEVTVDGTTGTLFVLPGSDPSGMIALVVGDDCGSDNPDQITRSDIG